MSWQSYWVRAISKSSMELSLFLVAPLYFLLFLTPKARKTCFAKFTARLFYGLCVTFIGTFIAWGFLMAIGYQYHGWD